jgi:hypothetical protein
MIKRKAGYCAYLLTSSQLQRIQAIAIAIGVGGAQPLCAHYLPRRDKSNRGIGAGFRASSSAPDFRIGACFAARNLFLRRTVESPRPTGRCGTGAWQVAQNTTSRCKPALGRHFWWAYIPVRWHPTKVSDAVLGPGS